MDFLSMTKEQRELVISKFNTYVTPGNKRDCWLFNGPKYKGGYGQFNVYNTKLNLIVHAQAHRVAWMIKYNANLPKELKACHTCDVPSCCNWNHVKVADARENTFDMTRKGRWRGGRGSHAQRPIEERIKVLQELKDGAIMLDLTRKYNIDHKSIKNWANHPDMISRFGIIERKKAIPAKCPVTGRYFRKEGSDEQLKIDDAFHSPTY